MPVDLERLRRLAAAEQGLATVATVRPDGTVHASVVNAGVLDNPVTGHLSVAMVIRGNARKLELFRTHGHATVVFRRGWEWVSVQGSTHLIGPDDPDPDFPYSELPQLLRDIFTAAGGTHDDWDTYDKVMAEQRRTAVFVEPARLSGNP